MTIRHLVALATNEEDLNGPLPAFLARSTNGDYEQAYKEFDEWYRVFDKSIPPEESNKAHYAIWGLFGASEQFHYEAGFRAGMQLAFEALSVQAVPRAVLEGRMGAKA